MWNTILCGGTSLEILVVSVYTLLWILALRLECLSLEKQCMSRNVAELQRLPILGWVSSTSILELLCTLQWRSLIVFIMLDDNTKWRFGSWTIEMVYGLPFS